MHVTIRALVKEAESQGWTAAINGNQHVELSNGTRKLVLPMTPSDHRALSNCVAQLRRAGLVIGGRSAKLNQQRRTRPVRLFTFALTVQLEDQTEGEAFRRLNDASARLERAGFRVRRHRLERIGERDTLELVSDPGEQNQDSGGDRDNGRKSKRKAERIDERRHQHG
jgi:hypothetical protein